MKKKANKVLVINVLVVGLIAFFIVMFKTLPSDTTKLSGKQVEETVPTATPTAETTSDIKYTIDDTNKYIGVESDNPSVISNTFDNDINLIGWTVDLSKSTNYEDKLVQSLEKHNYTSFITLEPNNMSLTAIAEGIYDDRFEDFFEEVTEGTRKETELFVSFAPEMETRPSQLTNWNTWQSDYGTRYVEAYRHVVELAREKAPNIKWVWSPTRMDVYTKAYYPGSDYVDYVSVSANNYSDSYTTFSSFLATEGREDFLKAYNKPIIFAECGEASSDETLKSKYIKSIFSYIKNNDNVIGVVLKDTDESDQKTYKFSDNTDQLEIVKNECIKLVDTERGGLSESN